jgi:hypothetical protein
MSISKNGLLYLRVLTLGLGLLQTHAYGHKTVWCELLTAFCRISKRAGDLGPEGV